MRGSLKIPNWSVSMIGGIQPDAIRRLAQNMTVEQMAERLLCSPTTYRSLEGGKPTVSLGLLAHALWLFGKTDELDRLFPLELGMLGNKRSQRARPLSKGIGDDERDF